MTWSSANNSVDDTRGCIYTITTWTSWWWAG